MSQQMKENCSLLMKKNMRLNIIILNELTQVFNFHGLRVYVALKARTVNRIVRQRRRHTELVSIVSDNI